MSTDTTDTADDDAQDAQDADQDTGQDTTDDVAGGDADDAQDATGDKAGDEPAGDEPPGDPPADPQQLMKWARDNLGVSDQTGKYTDDAAFLRAFDNQSRMLGQRDDDAQIGRRLRESGRQDELFGPPKEPEPKAPAVAPKNEIKLLEQVVRLLGDEAPPELVDRLKTARDRASDTMHQLMSDPEEFLKPHLEKMTQQLLNANSQTLQQQTVQQQLANDIGQIEQANPWMWVGGKAPQPGQQANLSPEGQQFVQDSQANKQNFGALYDEAGNQTQIGWNDAQVLKYTLDQHNGRQAGQRNPTRTPNKRARHTPNTATTIPPQKPPENEDWEDELKRLNDERIARETAALG